MTKLEEVSADSDSDSEVYFPYTKSKNKSEKTSFFQKLGKPKLFLAGKPIGFGGGILLLLLFIESSNLKKRAEFENLKEVICGTAVGPSSGGSKPNEISNNGILNSPGKKNLVKSKS